VGSDSRWAERSARREGVVAHAAPDSSDVDTEDWNRLAKQIEAKYLDYDGFVVIHGTDTMAYTACALSFMLENLGASPVLVPSCLSRTRARQASPW
jgi:L-asparaginase/Glu-tRNA(Gln) amidotransferase subunit D